MKYLRTYTKRQQELADFKEKNAAVFEEFDHLQKSVGEAEELLKAEARTIKQGAENNEFVVAFSQPVKKSYDYTLVQKYAKPEEIKLIDSVAVKHEVDYKKFQELVKDGSVSVELERRAYSMVELTPRISIKPKEHQYDSEQKGND